MEKWHIFFVDERHVPLTHADSNYHAAVSQLLLPVRASDSSCVARAGVVVHAPLTVDGGECRVGESLPCFNMPLLSLCSRGARRRTRMCTP
jgi:hypothetical protein